MFIIHRGGVPVNGNGKTVTLVAAIVAIIGGPLAVWGDAQRKNGEIETKLKALEKRQNEDRANVYQQVRDQNTKIDRIESGVNAILRKMDVIEDRQSRDRERERR